MMGGRKPMKKTVGLCVVDGWVGQMGGWKKKTVGLCGIVERWVGGFYT